jgi:hypothetical protein
MPPRVTTAERPRLVVQETSKFKSPQEELAFLREQVRAKEEQLEIANNQFEKDRIAKREVAAYAATPPREVLHENFKVDEHEVMHHVLKLEPEPHDEQMEGLLKIVQTHGIRNAIAIAERLKNPHIEDDLHRMLVAYIAEGLPNKGIPLPETVRYGLDLVLFEIFPQAFGEGKQDQQGSTNSNNCFHPPSSSMRDSCRSSGSTKGFSLEIAVPEGSEEAALYLAVPRTRQTLAERLMSSVFPNARINECRGDYNIFNPRRTCRRICESGGIIPHIL